jgi:hypothetical protein
MIFAFTCRQHYRCYLTKSFFLVWERIDVVKIALFLLFVKALNLACLATATTKADIVVRIA